jgi:hypothetical protein
VQRSGPTTATGKKELQRISCDFACATIARKPTARQYPLNGSLI